MNTNRYASFHHPGAPPFPGVGDRFDGKKAWIGIERLRHGMGVLLLLVAGTTPAALAQLFIPFISIDGGGATRVAGGTLQMTITIGQHDAATALSGGRLQVNTGFVPVVATIDPCTGFLCGDANCDGGFDGGDIDPFFLALGDPAAWEAAFPSCELLCVADINGDGYVNGGDIDAFFMALGVGVCP